MTHESKPQKLKCKFCHVKVNRWKKASGGRKIDGFETIRTHILQYHPEEAERMEMKW